MHIGLNRKYTGIALFLVLGVFILGLGLIVLTWQNLRQQQEHVMDQLEITGRAIIRSVEANLYRGALRGMGPGRWAEEGEFADMARDLLEELIAAGDVVFVDISGARGRLFISGHPEASGEFEPTPEMTAMAEQGIWKGTDLFMDRQVFIMGIPARRAEMMSRSRRAFADTETGLQGQGAVFIALDMARHLEVYSGFRQTIIYQTVFTLGAILLFWFLLLAIFRKKDERQQLSQLRTFHSRLLDNMPDGLLSVDQEQVVSAANPAAREILGAGPEIVGRRLSRIMPRGLDITSGRGWTQIELQGRFLEILFLPISREKESLVLIRDRTRMKELEKDLEHSRDLATLGRFAAGLAHEIRNPLSSLRGFAQYFLQKFDSNDPARGYARTMVMESDRLNRVVTDLLYLARPRAISPVRVNLQELFHELAGLLQSDLAAGKCSLAIEPGIPEVLADRDLLKQALINLVLNSLGAVEKGGRIVLGARSVGDMTEITVADNGRGMEPEVRERAMEPFFSGREKGTGLGLAIVQRVVKDHQGKISIESAPGRGTRIALLFPVPGGEKKHEN